MRRLALVSTLALLLVAEGAPVWPATLAGTVTLTAAPRRQRPVPYNRGVYRTSAERPTPKLPTPADVVVYLETAPASEAPAAKRAVMRQQGDRFYPHVLPITVGTEVEFPNEDDWYHNVFSIVAGDRFDLGRFGGGETATVRFEEEAIVVVRCEIHARMKAYIVVLGHPHFAVPDSSGAYRLDGIPPGSHTVKAWHPLAGERRAVVDLPPGTGVVNLPFDF